MRSGVFATVRQRITGLLEGDLPKISGGIWGAWTTGGIVRFLFDSTAFLLFDL